MPGRVLIVAGSDSGGGAGIQADIKAVTALGGYAMTAVTALTAQNTHGVDGIFEVAPGFIADQIRVVMQDLGADSVKLGMLHSSDVIATVARALEVHAPGVPIVADPVMVAKGGAALLQKEAVESLRTTIVPRATILTPNVPEAEALTGLSVTSVDGARAAAVALTDLGARAVLITGGHLDGAVVTDVFVDGSGDTEVFESPRIDTHHTHGTGCTLASAIACGVAQGLDLKDAVARALRYVHRAIETAPGLGGGHGPLNHGHTVTEFR